jgi:hypothetical protein
MKGFGVTFLPNTFCKNLWIFTKLEGTLTIDDFLLIEESTSIEQMPMFEGISNNT